MKLVQSKLVLLGWLTSISIFGNGCKKNMDHSTEVSSASYIVADNEYPVKNPKDIGLMDYRDHENHENPMPHSHLLFGEKNFYLSHLAFTGGSPMHNLCMNNISPGS